MQNYCVSADGGQGHAVGACARALHIVDLGPTRQKYATERQLNESHSVLIVHPLKSRGAEKDARKLPAMLASWSGAWRYLRRAPPVRLGNAALHRRRDAAGEKERPAALVARRAAHRLDERSLGPQEALLVRVEHHHQPDLGQIQGLGFRV